MSYDYTMRGPDQWQPGDRLRVPAADLVTQQMLGCGPNEEVIALGLPRPSIRAWSNVPVIEVGIGARSLGAWNIDRFEFICRADKLQFTKERSFAAKRPELKTADESPVKYDADVGPQEQAAIAGCGKDECFFRCGNKDSGKICESKTAGPQYMFGQIKGDAMQVSQPVPYVNVIHPYAAAASLMQEAAAMDKSRDVGAANQAKPPGRKDDSGKLDMILIDDMPRAIKAVVGVMQWAITKKKPDPYRRGSWQKVEPDRYRAARERHHLAQGEQATGNYLRGADGMHVEPRYMLDKETELLHEAHIACSALMALESIIRELEERGYVYDPVNGLSKAK